MGHVANLCGYIYESNSQEQESPLTIISISVQSIKNGNLLLSIPTKDRAHDCDPPTVSLGDQPRKQSPRQPAEQDSAGLEDIAFIGSEDKADLAPSLARCILYLFGSPWSDLPWTADSIQFLYRQASDEILNFRHPYVSCILRNDTAKDEEPETKCQRVLISLARLLLEIESSGIITLSVESPESPESQLHKVLDKTNIRGELPRYYAAIDACLKFRPALGASKKRDKKLEPDLRIRKVMYTTIIRPLEENLSQYQRRGARRGRDLRAKAGATGSSPVHFESAGVPKSSKRSPSLGISTGNRPLAAMVPHAGVQHSKEKRVKFADTFAAEKTDGHATESSQVHGPSYADQPNFEFGLAFSKAQRNEAFHVPGPYAMLSDAEPYGDEIYTSGWAIWLRDFTSFRDAILPNRVDPENARRVRVTVIDTGIDRSHPYIRSKGWRSYDENAEKHVFCDFLQPDPPRGTFDLKRHVPVDDDGHGTFIAGLLFQLAPDIELSVARIGATRGSLKTDAQVGSKVARAIEYALTEWKAEIISLSLSCEEASPELRKAVKRALSEDVIVMAAAGNSGNRKDIPYPAREEGVFKLFAANSHGFAAGFSPQPDPRDTRYNYHIQGCGVVSTWPNKLQERAVKDKLEVFCRSDHECLQGKCDLWTRMSGSSFATPISAALLAIIY